MQRTPTIFSAALTLLVAASLAWAADVPWKGKPYEQWNDQDLQRVFTDSPWARTTTIPRTWRPISEKDEIPTQIQGGVRELPRPNDSTRASETSVGGDLNFHVFWASARVMRAASARRSVLHGGQSVNVSDYAKQPQEEYQVVIQSEDMAPFFRHDEKFFQDSSYLEVRKTKLKLAPSHVHYERDQKGLVTSAVFFFAKKNETGTPTIAPDEKSVEFNCKIEGTNLRVTFEPQKMVDGQGSDL
jgi:hypothetical protein